MNKIIYVAVDEKIIGKISLSETTTLSELLKKVNKVLSSKLLVPGNFTVRLRINKENIVPGHVLSNKKYSETRPYRQIVEGESVVSYNNVFSGNKNTDLIILQNLNDKDLLNVCVLNKYANNLCKDEGFFRTRFINKFGQEAANYKPKGRTWREHYLKVISILNDWKQGGKVSPWRFFTNISYRLRDKKLSIIDREKNSLFKDIDKAPEKFQIGYWLLNLGNEIKIGYQTDRYDEIEPIIEKYKTDTYFTPAKVMKLIKEFYNKPVSEKEFNQQLEVDNQYAEDFTIKDVKDGNVKRKDLMPLFFEGFNFADGVRYIFYGS